MLDSSFDLFMALKKQNLLSGLPSWWWEGYGTFDVVLGSILTQNTQWSRVEKSLDSMRKAGILDEPHKSETNLVRLAELDSYVLESHINGFQKQKSVRIVNLARAIIRDFGSFKAFVESVSLGWLLEQKGIGCESAYSILNYACLREYMVVDKYTYKLLCALGRQIDEYEELREFCECGIRENLDSVLELYKGEINDINLGQIFARFHGKIVEFGKRKGDIASLKEAMGLN